MRPSTSSMRHRRGPERTDATSRTQHGATSDSALEDRRRMSDKRIRAVIFVAAAVWAVMLLLQGVDVGTALFKPLSSVIGVTILAMGFYERRLWRWRWLRRLQKQPILHGTWKGTLQTTWV